MIETVSPDDVKRYKCDCFNHNGMVFLPGGCLPIICDGANWHRNGEEKKCKGCESCTCKGELDE